MLGVLHKLAVLFGIIVSVATIAPLANSQASPESKVNADALVALCKQWEIPGCAVGMGKLGLEPTFITYGIANLESQQPVTEATEFRWASLSKILTATAVLGLVEENTLSLDSKVFDILSPMELPMGKALDEAYRSLTIEHCLRHTTGWDRGIRFDPMMRRTYQHAQRLFREAGNITPEMLLKTRLLYPPEFPPGTHFAYSNLGYVTLGLVLEKVTGEGYGDYISGHIADKIPAPSITPASTKGGDAKEAAYYDGDNSEQVASVANGSEQVPWPYGGFSLEALRAAAGWKSNILDALRCFLLISPVAGTQLPDATRQQTLSMQTASRYGKNEWYGLGWRIEEGAGGVSVAFHYGSMPGSSTAVACYATGECLVFLSNGRPTNWDSFNNELASILLVDETMNQTEKP